MSKIIIAGGRDFNDWILLLRSMKNFLDSGGEVDEIVSGKAIGADTLGERFAELIEVPVKEFPADWKKHGKTAGFIRNKQMAEYADTLIAFWDGKSHGTKHMIQQATDLDLDVIVIKY